MARHITRSEVPHEETWNLEEVFPTAESWERAFEDASRMIDSVAAYKGRLGEGASTVLSCLKARDALTLASQPVLNFARLRLAEDTTITASQEMWARAQALMAQIQAGQSFISAELLRLPDGTLERYMVEDPRLKVYAPLFEQLASDQPFTLGAEAEALVAALGDVLGAPREIYQRAMTTDVKYEMVIDSAGDPVQLSPFIMLAFQPPDETEIRRRSYRAITKAWSGHQNTLAATLATQIKKNVTLARFRGYPSTEAMLLNESPIPGFGNHGIPREIYLSILRTVQTEVAPHFRRYARLRKRVLGLDQLYLPDMGASLDPEYNRKMSYAEGAELIQEGLAVLGPEYGEILRRALHERWIYRGKNIGKANGAFCHFILGHHPYVFTPWNGGTRDLFVMAHELGHAGHMMLSMKTQPVSNMALSMFMLEAPSTMNEVLLGHHLLAKNQDKRFRRSVITSLLTTYYHNFVNHLLESELLHRAYALAEQERPLTARTFGQLKGEVLSDFWGGEMELDEGARLFWMAQGSYYSGVFPYTYAAGLSFATAVAPSMLEEQNTTVNRWLDVLKEGSSRKPLEQMRHVGVDMSTQEPVARACAYVGYLVEQLEETFQ